MAGGKICSGNGDKDVGVIVNPHKNEHLRIPISIDQEGVIHPMVGSKLTVEAPVHFRESNQLQRYLAKVYRDISYGHIRGDLQLKFRDRKININPFDNDLSDLVNLDDVVLSIDDRNAAVDELNRRLSVINALAAMNGLGLSSDYQDQLDLSFGRDVIMSFRDAPADQEVVIDRFEYYDGEGVFVGHDDFGERRYSLDEFHEIVPDERKSVYQESLLALNKINYFGSLGMATTHLDRVGKNSPRILIDKKYWPGQYLHTDSEKKWVPVSEYRKAIDRMERLSTIESKKRREGEVEFWMELAKSSLKENSLIDAKRLKLEDKQSFFNAYNRLINKLASVEQRLFNDKVRIPSRLKEAATQQTDSNVIPLRR